MIFLVFYLFYRVDFWILLCEMIEREGYLLKTTESQICNFLGPGPTHLLPGTLKQFSEMLP